MTKAGKCWIGYAVRRPNLAKRRRKRKASGQQNVFQNWIVDPKTGRVIGHRLLLSERDIASLVKLK